HARPTRPATFWNEEGHPELLAGKDLEAGGTWLGVTRSGRFAALTNIRSPGARRGPRSRGSLVLDYLTGRSAPEDYLNALVDDLAGYAGFNLLVGNMQQLWYLNSDEARPQALTPGLYGLSNAALNSPWPKLQALRQGLDQHLDSETDSDALLGRLRDRREYPDEQLPDSGVGTAVVRHLHPRGRLRHPCQQPAGHRCRRQHYLRRAELRPQRAGAGRIGLDSLGLGLASTHSPALPGRDEHRLVRRRCRITR